jgi:hypothetical protein
MNDFLDSLPSVRNLIKLIIILILAIIVVSLLLEIVKIVMPLLVLGAVVVGGYYLFKKLQTNGTV